MKKLCLAAVAACFGSGALLSEAAVAIPVSNTPAIVMLDSAITHAAMKEKTGKTKKHHKHKHDMKTHDMNGDMKKDEKGKM
jgi:hypothetical protein